MEEKYANDDDANKRQIIREFITIKEEKEKDLINLIEAAYYNGTIIYLYDEYLLNTDNFKGSINEVQRKLIKNIYTKRLSSQLSETVGTTLLNESNDEKLHRFFSGDEFKFFDTKGNYVGDHLKVIEEVTAKMKTRYIDGKSLEEELAIAPWGYSYGTISTTMAVLFRAGRLVVKFNDTEYFSHNEKSSHEVFSSSRKFKTARFKSISKKLDASQKNVVVQSLLDLKVNDYIDSRVDFKASDFLVSDAISQLANTFISRIKSLDSSQHNLQKLFPEIADHQSLLQQYSGKITEANYIDNVINFIDQKAAYGSAIQYVEKVEKFIKKNLASFNGFKRFAERVEVEMNKAYLTDSTLSGHINSFNESIEKDILKKFPEIKSNAQKIKDQYFTLMNEQASEMTNKYTEFLEQVKDALNQLNEYPEELNKKNQNKLTELKNYATSKQIGDIQLEYHVECQNSGYSLSELMSSIQLLPSKKIELETIKTSFVEKAPDRKDEKEQVSGITTKNVTLNLAQKEMKAEKYRMILSAQLQAIAHLEDEDMVNITLK